MEEQPNEAEGVSQERTSKQTEDEQGTGQAALEGTAEEAGEEAQEAAPEEVGAEGISEETSSPSSVTPIELPEELRDFPPEVLRRLFPGLFCQDLSPDNTEEALDVEPPGDRSSWLSWFEELPIEILVKIIDKLPDKEVCRKIRTVSKKWGRAAFIVMSRKLRKVQLLIQKNLENSRDKLSTLINVSRPENLEEEMTAAAKFSFFQIIDSEYKILRVLFLSKSSEAYSSLIFQTYEIVAELMSLLDEPEECNWSSRARNISSAVENLRNLNTKIISTYFWRVWNVKKEPLGMIIFKLMNISFPCKYNITLSHELEPMTKHAKCHLSGSFEIVDQSNALASPPSGVQNLETDRGVRVLASYICNTIRWGNLFHTLRLRWVWMDRSLTSGGRPAPGGQMPATWPLLSTAGISPLEKYKTEMVSEEVVELRNGMKKVKRLFQKGGDEMTGPPANWLGIKCNLQLWCPIRSEPLGFIDNSTYAKAWNSELPPADSCKMPYLFKMEYKSCVRAKQHRSQGIVESVIWVEETSTSINISQTTNLINTPL